MTRSRRWLVAVCIGVVVLPALTGCHSEPGTGDKKTDDASFKGGPMPPEARARMEAALESARNKGQEHHEPATTTQ
jgi:hypothetical protein